MPPADPDGLNRRVVMGLCVRGAMSQLRRREDHLGWLCADGVIDVLDGAILIRGSEPCRGVRFRSLQNLPRTAALPDTVWVDLCEQLTASTDTVAAEHDPDLLLVHSGALIEIAPVLVAFAAPISPGEAALITFLNPPAGSSGDYLSDTATVPVRTSSSASATAPTSVADTPADGPTQDPMSAHPVNAQRRRTDAATRARPRAWPLLFTRASLPDTPLSATTPLEDQS